MQHAGEPMQVLLPDGTIQQQMVADLRHHMRISRRIPREHHRRITRQQVLQGENDHADQQHRGKDLQQPDAD